jgi:CRISPR-associated protein Csm2
MSVQEIIRQDKTGEKLVKLAEEKGQQLSRSLKRTQIRGIFTEARRIEAQWQTLGEEKAMRRLNMLKPKLHYQAKRNPDVEPLRALLVEAIDEVAKGESGEKRLERFERFMELFEAILAYHRFYGGN